MNLVIRFSDDGRITHIGGTCKAKDFKAQMQALQEQFL